MKPHDTLAAGGVAAPGGVDVHVGGVIVDGQNGYPGANGPRDVGRGTGGQTVNQHRVGREGEHGVVAGQDGDDVVCRSIAGVLEVESQGHGVAGIERSRGDGGNHSVGSCRLDHVDEAESSAVLLCRGGEAVGAGSQGGRQQEGGITRSVGEGRGDKGTRQGVSEGHIGVGRCHNRICRSAAGHRSDQAEGHGVGLGHIGHQ